MYIIKGLVKLAGSIMTQGEKFKWVLISLNLTERVTPLKNRQQSNSENAIYKQWKYSENAVTQFFVVSIYK